MRVISRRPTVLFLLATIALPASGSLSAQAQEAPDSDVMATVVGSPPADLSQLTAGPEVEGFISARTGDRIQVTTAAGDKTVIALSDGTKIKASGGFLGLNSNKVAADALLNGLPVTAKTVKWGTGLVASQVEIKSKDLKTAKMIHTGTAQGFAQQTAATEALRGRMSDIDKYNIKGTTNVYFDTGKTKLSGQGQSDLCAAAAQAETTNNALLLVVGYTDSVGDYDYNQELSEKRASRVVNYLQQACGWKPYRMLTPTGMAEADPMADNETPEGRAQNRRVSVNILVSKGLDGL